MQDKLAVIDLGSNSVRLAILDNEEVIQKKESVRLSENMGKENILKEEPIERTISVLEKFREIINHYKIDMVYAIATEAVRRAVNKDVFLAQVSRETGFDFRVISGQEEAYYDYLGVMQSLNIKDCVIMDTGGGSTEVILVKDGKLQYSESIPYGAVVITEQFKTISSAEEKVADTLSGFAWLSKGVGLPIIGLGGSIRAVGKVFCKTAPLHGFCLNIDQAIQFYEDIRTMNAEQRAEIKGISKERSDIIVGGLVPLTQMIKQINARELVISRAGLREGIIFEHFSKKENKTCKNS